MSEEKQQPIPRVAIVKQILTGDSVSLRSVTNKPNLSEKQINFEYISAPKLARRPGQSGSQDSKDEPCAWEAREFLRKKLIGEPVWFVSEKLNNSSREVGSIRLGRDYESAENIIESLIKEGLASVRMRNAGNNKVVEQLFKLQDEAKSAAKGIWAPDAQKHVRDVKWSIDDTQKFLTANQGKTFDAVIEHVRDGSTIRAFLLPDFYYITLMISGIRCPPFLNDDGASAQYADEAKFYVESRLLQHDVKIVLESSTNQTFVGSVLHEKGNIAELLLKNGLAKFIDWHSRYSSVDVDGLKAAEAAAKEKRIGIWKDYKPSGPVIPDKDKLFSGIVTEISNGAESIMVKLDDGTVKKVFFSSLKLPKDVPKQDDENIENVRNVRILSFYNNVRLFEAREFLRKKLIRKKVNIVVDYIQVARDNFPEKSYATVTIGNEYVSEQLVAKGLATVLRHRQDDEQKSSRYTELLAAEKKAEKNQVGVFSKKPPESNRIVDISSAQVAKKHLNSLIRAGKIDVLVDFVASGSKVRVYWPKEHKLFNFLLSGIKCPRTAMRNIANSNNTSQQNQSEPFAEEALQYVRDKCMQREVTIKIESIDKVGNFIGWLWVDNVNLSVALVKEGFAENFSDYSEFSKEIQAAQEEAKKKKLRRWATYVEEPHIEKKIDDTQVVRKREIKYEEVIVIRMSTDAHIYVQKLSERVELEDLFDEIQNLMRNNILDKPILKRGHLCAAQFSHDGNWYRAKIEKVSGNRAQVFYIDYGNREDLDISRLSSLPDSLMDIKPFAHEYVLACVKLPSVEDYLDECLMILEEKLISKTFLLNVEYKDQNSLICTLTDKETKEDVIEKLIEEGVLIVQTVRRREMTDLLEKYRNAEELARKQRHLIWEYGDIRDDDAKEFGAGR